MSLKIDIEAVKSVRWVEKNCHLTVHYCLSFFHVSHAHSTFTARRFIRFYASCVQFVSVRTSCSLKPKRSLKHCTCLSDNSSNTPVFNSVKARISRSRSVTALCGNECLDVGLS